MADHTQDQTQDHDNEDAATSGDVTTKKSQIVALYLSGMHEVEDLALVTNCRPSYIATVLRESGLEQSYFDLYTSTKHPMNVYSKFFADKLGFKNVEVAEQSVELIDTLFTQFDLGHDRAGQHHAMMMAMTMANRAQWTGKYDEAQIYREWLIGCMQDLNDQHAAYKLAASQAGEEEE